MPRMSVTFDVFQLGEDIPAPDAPSTRPTRSTFRPKTCQRAWYTNPFDNRRYDVTVLRVDGAQVEVIHRNVIR